MSNRFVLVVMLLILVFPSAALAGTEPIVSSDLLRLRSIGSIDVSEDGTTAVFTVRSIGRVAAEDGGDDPNFVNQQHLFLLDLRQKPPAIQQLTFGDRRDRRPRLSRDGRHIAFVRSGTGANATPQVWIIAVGGGEARALTDLENGASRPRWSPDGRSIMFTSSVAASELSGPAPWPQEPDVVVVGADEAKPSPDGDRSEIRAWLRRNAAAANPVVINRLEFQGEHDLREELKFRQIFTARAFDAAGVATAPGEASVRQLTTRMVDHTSPEFMPDGRSVVYAADVAGRHPDVELRSELRRLTIEDGVDEVMLSLEEWTLAEPRPSADGSVVAFTGEAIATLSYSDRVLAIVPTDNAGADSVMWLTDTRSATSDVYGRYDWVHARGALCYTAAREGSFPLMMISPGLLEPAVVVDEMNGRPMGVRTFDVGGPTTVYAATTVERPCVLRISDGFGHRTVFDLNPWVAQKAVSIPRMQWLTRPDGTKVQYWVMEPTGRSDGETYPLVLEIHGGPSAMWGPGELSMWHEFQLLCSWGYGVVYANPRGSGGYGYEFRRANFQDWGEGPAGDVLAAVDAALLLDWVDANRLVVTGGSYGGYLTAWIIAHDYRFKAAVAQRGVYDLTTFFGEGNAWWLVPWHMGGSPADQRYRNVIRRNSPFTFVDRIRTPLLIMHASNDLRTGVSQSEMLYRALKLAQRPVEYIRYPDAGHDLSRTGNPAQRLDRVNRILEFFERYISNPRPAPQVSVN